MAAPPILAPNGKAWNYLVINSDDAPVDWFGATVFPLFNANWASDFIVFPNAACNMPLCTPARAAALLGWRIERHHAWDNDAGANIDLTQTFLVNLKKHGYYTGAIGKWFNGFGGAFGTQARQPGVDYQRLQWGPVGYLDWVELDETGDITTDNGNVVTARVHHLNDSRAAYTDTGYTDYCTDIEADRVREFLTNAVASGRPFVLYYAPKASHQDGSDPENEAIPPVRHQATSVTLTEDASFGRDGTVFGIPSWIRSVAETPWNASVIAEVRAAHTQALRTMRGLDEGLHLIFQKLVTLGLDQNTVVILKTDNTHSSGELRLKGKGTPHRSGSAMLMRVRVPGQAGGTCDAAVSDIDIAPFLYAMAGIKPQVGCDGMSFHRCIVDKSATFREASPMSNPMTDSPKFHGLWFSNGSLHYRLTDDSNKGAGQEGGWADVAMTTNVNIRGAAEKLGTIMRKGPQILSLPERALIDGKVWRSSSTGEVLDIRWVNQGTWNEDYEGDAEDIVALGVGGVRIVGPRWWGDDYETGIDAYSPNIDDDFVNPLHLAKLVEKVAWARSAGLKVGVAIDSNNGAGNRGLGVGIPNFFEASAEGLTKYEQYKIMSRRVARELLAYDVTYVELLAEPLPRDSDSSYAAPLRAMYLDLATNYRSVDPRMAVLIGPRDSYGLSHLSEIVIPELSNYGVTSDFLTNKVSSEGTIAANVEIVAAFRDANNIAVLQQQVGRESGDDIGDINADDVADTTENIGLTAMCGALFLHIAHGIPFAWWQWHQNTGSSTAYALYYKTTYPGSGPNNWTPKAAELAVFEYFMTITNASLKAAATAAATAAAGSAYADVLDDFSNCYQDEAGTIPVTAAGQKVLRVTETVGGGYWSQTDPLLAPTLVALVNGYGLNFPADTYLNHSTTYFASGDDMIVVSGGRPPTGAANRVIFNCGNSSSTARNGYLGVLATDLPQFSLRGDDNVLRDCQGVTTCDDRAVVLSGMRVGANKRAFVNGVQEGTTNTGAVGSIASITRTRWGATTTGANGWGGPSPGIFLSKTATDEHRRHIERRYAWKLGAAYRGAIPV
jgi:arylsulfatase A-like enzyme